MSDAGQTIGSADQAVAALGEGAVAARQALSARLKAALRFAAREPFFQFLFLGILIWGAAEYIEAQNQRYVIHIGPAERQRLAILYQQQYSQVPNGTQLRDLVDRYVKEEIFLREGLALGLDKDDEIVRRRIAQKFEFIQQDLAVPDPPSDAVLQQWFAAHRANYLIPGQVAFTQIYFSGDRDSDAAAYGRAQATLATLNRTHATRAVDLGDAFPGPSDISAVGPDEAGRIFGQSQLSTELFKLPAGKWIGPLRSGYGWHLVYINGHIAPRLPRFAEVHDKVLADYQEAQRHHLNDEAYRALRAKYRIDTAGDGQ